MDAPDVDPAQLDRSLRFLRRINRLLGYNRAVIGHFRRFSRRWRRGERIDILDIGTGSADLPVALLRWADRQGFDLRIVGVDLHEKTVELARRQVNDPRIRIVQADALDLPFADASFDYVTTTLFLHHLDDEDAERVLRSMARLARRGVVAADLLRHRRAYFWVRLLTLASNPIVRNDGPASIAQAFTKSEILALRDRAGLTFAGYHRHFGHRFALAGERSQPSRHL